jgi:hypothetical protein
MNHRIPLLRSLRIMGRRPGRPRDVVEFSSPHRLLCERLVEVEEETDSREPTATRPQRTSLLAISQAALPVHPAVSALEKGTSLPD